jgi:oligopeptide/dipeptide ABC transporter ATP-binding protein
MSEPPAERIDAAVHDASSTESALLRVDGLRKVFRPHRTLGKAGDEVLAVDDVSFHVRRGEAFGLVGESGCGKSTLARCVARLLEPTAGSIVLDGRDYTNASRTELRAYRRRVQILLQDPLGSLDPRMSIARAVAEPLRIHGDAFSTDPRQVVAEMLEMVGIARKQFDRRPHEFSGGQRQRIALARALVLRPDVVILDEPVSALDVSVQGQVLNLLLELQETFQLTYLFIVHDLGLAHFFCDRVAVLYRGGVVELAESDQLFANPLHPYTAALLDAAPTVQQAGRGRARPVLRGEVTAVTAMESGCRFASRCPIARPLCANDAPLLEAISPRHRVACHFPGEPLGSPASAHRTSAR